jgi:hypothetical protein
MSHLVIGCSKPRHRSGDGSLDVNNAEWVVTGVIVTALSLGAAIVLLVIL